MLEKTRPSKTAYADLYGYLYLETYAEDVADITADCGDCPVCELPEASFTAGKYCVIKQALDRGDCDNILWVDADNVIFGTTPFWRLTRHKQGVFSLTSKPMPQQGMYSETIDVAWLLAHKPGDCGGAAAFGQGLNLGAFGMTATLARPLVRGVLHGDPEEVHQRSILPEARKTWGWQCSVDGGYDDQCALAAVVGHGRIDPDTLTCWEWANAGPGPVTDQPFQAAATYVGEVDKGTWNGVPRAFVNSCVFGGDEVANLERCVDTAMGVWHDRRDGLAR